MGNAFSPAKNIPSSTEKTRDHYWHPRVAAGGCMNLPQAQS